MLVAADSEKTFLPRRAETLRAMVAPSLHPSAPSPRTHTSLTLGGTSASARAKGAIATTTPITRRGRQRAKSVLLAKLLPILSSLTRKWVVCPGAAQGRQESAVGRQAGADATIHLGGLGGDVHHRGVGRGGMQLQVRFVSFERERAHHRDRRGDDHDRRRVRSGLHVLRVGLLSTGESLQLAGAL